MDLQRPHKSEAELLHEGISNRLYKIDRQRAKPHTQPEQH